MRYFILTAIFILIGCIPKTNRQAYAPEKSIESYYTQAEKKINKCFKSIKFKCGDEKCEREETKACLEDTQYAAALSRKPSSARKASMIESNRWFFESDLNLLVFYDVLQGLIRARDDIRRTYTQIKAATNRALHGTGIAVSGSAYFGVGSSWTAEIINHQNSVALFCAPGNTITTDIGITPISLAGVATLNCPSNERYEGTFISVAAGVSGEVLLVPAEATIAYSYGFNVDRFFSEIQKAKIQGFDKTKLLAEYNGLIRSKEYFSLNQKYVINTVGSFMNFIFDTAPVPRGFDLDGFDVKSLIRRDNSFGQIAKDYLGGQTLQNFLRDNGYSNMQLISKAIAAGFTGCDSVAGAASISLSLSPASITLEHSYYKKLLSVRLGALTNLKNLSAFALANPFLMEEGTIGSVVQLARVFTTLPSQMRSCRMAQRSDLQRLLSI